MSSPLILRESTHKRGKVGFIVFAIKPSHVPSPEREFHRKIKEATYRAGLESTYRAVGILGRSSF
jgi:hypothetical protein